MSTPAQVYDDATATQKHAAGLAVFFGLAATIMTAYWANDSRTNENFLGGLNWQGDTFNWHPVLMVAGTMLCMVTSLVSYRVLPFSKLIQKSIHGILHTGGIVCLSIGLVAIFQSQNHIHQSSTGTYSSNFTSLHTFIGLAVFILYGLNYVMGIVHFVLPFLNTQLVQAFLRTHVFLGAFILLCALAAILTGLGILTGRCGYNVTSADLNPAQNYYLLTSGCQLTNAIGIVVLLTVFLCYYAIFRFHSTAPLAAAAAAAHKYVP